MLSIDVELQAPQSLEVAMSLVRSYERWAQVTVELQVQAVKASKGIRWALHQQHHQSPLPAQLPPCLPLHREQRR